MEKRNARNSDDVLLSIQLEEKVADTAPKQMALSNDGSVCAIGGGNDKKYFYLVDLESKEQHKISGCGDSTYAPIS